MPPRPIMSQRYHAFLPHHGVTLVPMKTGAFFGAGTHGTTGKNECTSADHQNVLLHGIPSFQLTRVEQRTRESCTQDPSFRDTSEVSGTILRLEVTNAAGLLADSGFKRFLRHGRFGARLGEIVSKADDLTFGGLATAS
jgi:hypothetical protein